MGARHPQTQTDRRATVPSVNRQGEARTRQARWAGAGAAAEMGTSSTSRSLSSPCSPVLAPVAAAASSFTTCFVQ